MDTYPAGMAFVVWLISGIVLTISIVQLRCQQNGWPSLSYQVGHWAADNPWWARVFMLTFFFLLGHFVLNPLHPQ